VSPSLLLEKIASIRGGLTQGKRSAGRCGMKGLNRMRARIALAVQP